MINNCSFGKEEKREMSEEDGSPKSGEEMSDEK